MLEIIPTEGKWLSCSLKFVKLVAQSYKIATIISRKPSTLKYLPEKEISNGEIRRFSRYKPMNCSIEQIKKYS